MIDRLNDVILFGLVIVAVLVISIDGRAEQKMVSGVALVEVPAGTFQMGDLWGDGFENERPVHDVSLDGFYMGQYEVTNAQYAKFLNEYGRDTVKAGEYQGQVMIDTHEWGLMKTAENLWQPQNGCEDHPVVKVSWYGAHEFCRYYGFRLPTAAEWEYAARSGGQKEKWAGVNDDSLFTDYGWYGENSGGQTQAVGQKRPNGLGLYDMSGNVKEWCADWFSEGYYQRCIDEGITTNPFNTEMDTVVSLIVVRGGAWSNPIMRCRVTDRDAAFPVAKGQSLGFRVVLARDEE